MMSKQLPYSREDADWVKRGRLSSCLGENPEDDRFPLDEKASWAEVTP